MTRDELYLTRARLRHDAPVSAIRTLLSPADQIRIAAGHRLVWALFGDDPERKRDFLWREAERGTYYLLSARPPEDRHGLFHLEPPKVFEPVLSAGSRLHFALRVNATVARQSEGKPQANGRIRGGRCDVVMDALAGVPRGQRATLRHQVLPSVATAWLGRQGEAHGFALAEREHGQDWEIDADAPAEHAALRVMGYRVLRFDRGRGANPMRVGVLDIEGTLIVRDPYRFIPALGHGFGRAKAFGCGLMLIRRAA